MKKTMGNTRWAMLGIVLILMLQVPGWAAAQTTFNRIVVFGDSLSDPGNAFVFVGAANTPPCFPGPAPHPGQTLRERGSPLQ